MTLAIMLNNTSRFVPGLHPELVKSALQDSYRTLAAMDWNQLKVQQQIFTAAPYATGTVGIDAAGVVTGVGTTFTSAMVGRFMKVYYADGFFEIETYSSPTSVTLNDWTGAVVAAGTSYSIFKTIYACNATFGEVTEVIYQVRLKKKSQSYLNAIDPSRTLTSDSPLYWAYAGQRSSDKAIQIEIYPPPTEILPLRLYGILDYATLGLSDTPYLPEDLIEAHALLSCYQMMALQKPTEGWEKKIPLQAQIYKDKLDIYQDADYSAETHFPGRVIDAQFEPLYPVDDTFALSHDVE